MFIRGIILVIFALMVIMLLAVVPLVYYRKRIRCSDSVVAKVIEKAEVRGSSCIYVYEYDFDGSIYRSTQNQPSLGNCGVGSSRILNINPANPREVYNSDEFERVLKLVKRAGFCGIGIMLLVAVSMRLF